MDVEVHIANAFVDGHRGGNPAGVVVDADGLTPEHRLAVAQQVGLSETAFVSASSQGDFSIEFYTPRRQIAQCGHATVAAACVLRGLRRLRDGSAAMETVDGIRMVIVDGDTAFLEQRPPQYRSIGRDGKMLDRILRSLGIGGEDLLVLAPPTVVDTGNAFVLVGVRTAQRLQALIPDYAAIEAVSTELDVIGFYVFCLNTQVAGRDAAARMFAPRYGIEEESATGMAAGPLACVLHDCLGHESPVLQIEQGNFMAKPSPSALRVELDVDKGRIVGLIVGGAARITRTLRLRIPQ